LPTPLTQNDYSSLLKFLREVAKVRLKTTRKLDVGSDPDFLLLADLRDLGRCFREELPYGVVAELEDDGLEMTKEATTAYKNLRRLGREANNAQVPAHLRFGMGLVQGRENEKIVRYPLVSYPLVAQPERRGVLTVEADRRGAWQLEREVATPALTGLGDDGLQELNEALLAILEGEHFGDQIESVRELMEVTLGVGWSGVTRTSFEPKENTTIRCVPLLFLHRGKTNAYGEFIDRILKTSVIRSELLKGLLGGKMQPLSEAKERYRLPLSANAEQEKIVDSLQRLRVAKVQGPPGTGKSHTIANVLAPLMAAGKRVLVLTENEVALEAIRQKVPLLLRPFLLELDAGHRAKSVADLVEQRYDLKPEVLQNDAAMAAEKLRALDDRRALLLRQWSAWATEVPLCFGAEYTGTADTLTQRLNEEKPDHIWYKDKVQEEDMGDGAQVQNLVEWQSIEHQLVSVGYVHGETFVPNLAALPTPDELRSYAEARATFKYDFRRNPIAEEEEGYAAPALVKDETITPAELEAAITAYATYWETIPANDWCAGVAVALAAANAHTENLIRSTTERLAALKISGVDELLTDYACLVGVWEIRRVLLELKQLSTGFHLPEWTKSIYTPAIPELPYAISGVLKIRNDNPGPKELIKVLERFIALRATLDYFDENWATTVGTTTAQAEQTDDLTRLSQYRTRLADLETMRAAATVYHPYAVQLSRWLGVPLASLYQQDRIEALNHALAHRRAAHRYGQLKRKINLGLEELERHDQLDQLVINLTRCLKKPSVPEYLNYYPVAEQRRVWYTAKERNYTLEKELEPSLPKTVKELRLKPRGLPFTVAAVEAARAHHFARAKLEAHLANNEQRGLALFGEIDKERLKYTERLLVARTALRLHWEIEEPTEFQRYLSGWLNLSKAKKNQAASRVELGKALPQVPCVMATIGDLTELVDPESEMFNLIVVDEASMLTSAALCLLYLTDQIMVIGDDQQISPLFVGTKKKRFANLAGRYLTGSLANQLVGNDSLFKLIGLLPHRSVNLREHFRCVPEIIQYSNDICYQPLERPLLPLRKVSVGRTRPLEAVMVSGAEHEMKGNSPINKVEAKWIVDRVEQIIALEPDAKTSIGIITLLGDHQYIIIQKLLLERIPAEQLDRRSIFAGKPTHYQGAERDIIILSLVTAPGHVARPRNDEMSRQRFNVATSRAKDQLIVFCSQPEGELKGVLQNKLLSHCRNYQPPEPVTENLIPETDYERSPPEGYKSWFHVDVARDVFHRGYSVYTKEKIGKLMLDLVVARQDGSRLVIICPPVRQLDADEWKAMFERYLVLVRSKWDVRIVNPHLYELSPGLALDAVINELGPPTGP
jgi:hypothetical protein